MASRERLELVAKLAGFDTVTQLAEAAGIKAGTAQKHKDRDSIPPRVAWRYIAAAEKRGVQISLEWLHEGRGRPPRGASLGGIPRSVPKLSTEDTVTDGGDIAPRVPLWQISVIQRGSGASVQHLFKSEDQVVGPTAIKDITNSFAVRLWDSSNGPYLPRGTLIFVERPHSGAEGGICLFAADATETEVMRPVVGILDSETDTAWCLIQGQRRVELAKAEFPHCWRVSHFRRD